MSSSEQNQLPRFLGQEVFDTWQLGDKPAPDPLDRNFGPGIGNLKELNQNRDFPALARKLHEIDQERQAKESSIVFKLRQLGDAGLRAAMRKLKGE